MRLVKNHNAFTNAFTLAEVLITLTIIGIVAAMTMPTLINNTNGAQFKTAYKKALSVLNQAVVMNIALEDYDLAGTSAYDASDTDKMSISKILSKRTNGTLYTGVGEGEGQLKNYTVDLCIDDMDAGASTKFNSVDLSTYHIYTFQDGILFAFDPTQHDCTEVNPCYGFIDANGVKGPNKNSTCENEEDSEEAEEITTLIKECSGEVTVKDIFPVKMYAQTIAPASASARAVLYGAENQTNKDSEP